MANKQDHADKDPDICQPLPEKNWMDRVSNKDLWDRTHQAQIEIKVLKRSWGWLCHTLRKPSTNITRQVLMWNPQGKRKRGKPKTPGGVTSMQTSSKQGMAGNNWRGLPKTGGAGEMLWMAYAPGRVKGLIHNTPIWSIVGRDF